MATDTYDKPAVKINPPQEIDIDTALKLAGLEKLNEDPIPTGKGSTGCFNYAKETERFRIKVTVQITPKLEILKDLLGR